ncbi:MAG: DNA primase [Candidatus Pacebacteria bacterium]|nr:DNA primase [Candidatus Paceibacterota bacterium]
MSSTVEKIKDRLGVVEVISKYIQLERAGLNFRARCPFHNEKTPSFFVSPGRNSWHCFGCAKGGDIISFVEEIEGLDFVGALKVLAPWAGVELEVWNKEESDDKQRLYQIMDKAAGFFQTYLSENEAAKNYLLSRGLKPETIDNFRLGFAPTGWRHVADKLNLAGFKDEELVEVGLVVKPTEGAGTKGNRSYERFRSRLMFPLFDSAGRVVGFSGRVFEGKDDEAKYINSPETKLYDKSRLLYGYDRAKLAIRSANRAILVEGQIDLVMAHQAGLTETVAVSGTALTVSHLQQLKRLTDNLVMSFDPDLAGVNAARRAIDLALALGFEIKAALLPAGQDPAEVIKDSPEKFIKAVGESKHIIDFYLSVVAGGEHEARELNRLVTRDVIPYVKRLPNALDQAHFVKKIASFLNMTEEPVWAEVRKVPGAAVAAAPVAPAPATVSRTSRLERLLFGLYLWQEGAETPRFDQASLIENLKTFLGEEFKGREEFYRSLGQELLFEIELSYEGSGKLHEEIIDLLASFRREKLKQDLTDILVLIRQAEAAGDQAKLDSYLKKCQDITQALNT